MQAYYETKIEVPEDHQVTVKLPEDIPPGPVKLAIIYETEAARNSDREKRRARMQDFLTNLPLNTTGGLSQEEIRARIDEERSSWDD